MEKGKKKSGLAVGLIIFGVLALGSIVPSGIAEILDESETTKVVSSKTEEKKIEQPKQAEAPKEEVKTEKPKRGRCEPDLKGNRPSYLNDIGYITVDRFDYSSEDLLKGLNRWEVHLVEQIGPAKFQEIDKTMPHKTRIKVIEEHFGDDSQTYCKGALKVKSIETNEEFFINVKNFSTEPYWDLEPIKALNYGIIIAEYIDDSLVPVNKEKEWYEIPKGTKVLINYYSGPEKIQGFILDKNNEIKSSIK